MKKKRAFTLVETLMSAGIFGMLMVMGISIAALVTGIFKCILSVKRVPNLTSAGTTVEYAGTNKTSSKV